MRKRPSWLPSLWTGTLKNLKFHRSCSLCRGLFSLFSEFCLACHVSYCQICFCLLMWYGSMRAFAADHLGTSCLGGIVFASHCASSSFSPLARAPQRNWRLGKVPRSVWCSLIGRDSLLLSCLSCTLRKNAQRSCIVYNREISYLLCMKISCVSHYNPNTGCCRCSLCRPARCSRCRRPLSVPLSYSRLSPDFQ